MPPSGRSARCSSSAPVAASGCASPCAGTRRPACANPARRTWTRRSPRPRPPPPATRSSRRSRTWTSSASATSRRRPACSAPSAAPRRRAASSAPSAARRSARNGNAPTAAPRPTDPPSSARSAASRTGTDMTTDPRRAGATFALSDAGGAVTHQGEAEAVIGDDALGVGPVTVSFLDADALRAADYRIELDLWPGGRLALTQLGRRFDAFTAELRRTRNQARVAGLLAHGTTMPEVFGAAVLEKKSPRPAELQIYDTHVTIVPEDGDPWQVPLGAVTAVQSADDPPAVVLESDAGPTTIGQLARRRDACHALLMRRLEEQRQVLEGLTGQPGFSDG